MSSVATTDSTGRPRGRFTTRVKATAIAARPLASAGAGSLSLRAKGDMASRPTRKLTKTAPA
ncbi:hypothetical protein ABZ299_23505 [Streptomyces sp. NPDC006184]|uniref:hypothetical protein n=1 Tax=Streptomyces sp. NPDC006184 TaxID=3155455 RepID=UPI0033A79BEB